MQMSDDEAVARILNGETSLFEVIMRRYNQRLYRVARAILRQDHEAEDVVQDAYVRAYAHLDQFAGRAAFATWLTRIAIHEALGRKRRSGRMEELEAVETKGEHLPELKSAIPDPETESASAEARQFLERAIGSLPEDYRIIVVLREVEEMTVAETAASLEVSEGVVKTRLHRAHAMLRKELYKSARGRIADLYQFHASRCDRIVQAVFERIRGNRPRPAV